MELLRADDDVCPETRGDVPVAIAPADSPLAHRAPPSQPATAAAAGEAAAAGDGESSGRASPLDLRSVLVVLSRFLEPTRAVAVRIASLQWVQQILLKAPNRVHIHTPYPY